MSNFKNAFLFPIALGFVGLLASPVSAQDACVETLESCGLILLENTVDPCLEVFLADPIEATEAEACYELTIQLKNNCFGDVLVNVEGVELPQKIGLAETIDVVPGVDDDKKVLGLDVIVLNAMDIRDDEASGKIEVEIDYQNTVCEEEPVDEEPVDEPIDEEPIDEPIDEEPTTGPNKPDDTDSGCSSSGTNNATPVALIVVFSFFALLRRRLL